MINISEGIILYIKTEGIDCCETLSNNNINNHYLKENEILKEIEYYYLKLKRS